MKKSELIGILQKSGYILSRQGKKHEIWKKNGYPSIPVSRTAKEIPTGTCKDILKAAGIKF